MNKLGKIKSIIARYLGVYLTPWANAYWSASPLADNPLGTKQAYLDLWDQERENEYPEIDSLESELGTNLNKEWLDELALHTQIVIKSSPLCYQHGRILYSALKAYATKSEVSNLTLFETGTARGFSSVIMSRALNDANQNGKILTFDVLPHEKPIYWNCIDDHEGKKTRKDLLSSWAGELENIIFLEGDSRINLKNTKVDRIHFAFLDGAHSYEHVLFEYETIAKYQKPGDMIVFDDYNERDFGGLVRAVDEGSNKFSYDKKIIRLSGKDRAYVIATKK